MPDLPTCYAWCDAPINDGPASLLDISGTEISPLHVYVWTGAPSFLWAQVPNQLLNPPPTYDGPPGWGYQAGFSNCSSAGG